LPSVLPELFLPSSLGADILPAQRNEHLNYFQDGMIVDAFAAT